MYHGQAEIEHSQVRLQVPPWPLETIISMWEPQLLICQGFMPSNIMLAHSNESLANEIRPFRHPVLYFKASLIWHNLRWASSAS